MLSFTPHEYEAPIPESLTRGGLIGVRGFPDGKPLSPRSLPRVRIPGLNVQHFICLLSNVILFFFLCFHVFKVSNFQNSRVVFQVPSNFKKLFVCVQLQIFKISKCHFFKLHGPVYIWEHKKRKVVTKTNLYKRYSKILFHKVALGYLLHFVQNGSSNTRTNKYVFAQTCQTSKNIHYIFPP